MDSSTFAGIGQGLNQATGTMLNTGMRLREQNIMQAQQEQQIKLAQDKNQREQIIFETAEKDRIEQEMKNNKVVYASKYVPNWGKLPGFQKSIADALESTGAKFEVTPTGDIAAANKDWKAALQHIHDQPEKTETLLKNVYGDLNGQILEKQNLLPTLKKPEEVAAMQKEIATLKDKAGETLQMSWDLQKKLAEKDTPDKLINVAEGGAVIDRSGNVIYKNPKTIKPEEIAKKQDKEVKQLENDKRIKYTIPIANFKAEIDKITKYGTAEPSPEQITRINLLQEQINEHTAQSNEMDNIIAGVQNGEYSKKDLVYSKKGEMVKQKVIKVDEAMATALIKEAGSVEGARKLAKERGLVF